MDLRTGKQHFGIDDEDFELAFHTLRHRTVKQVGHGEGWMGFQIFELRLGRLARDVPVVIAHHGVKREARLALTEGAEGLIQHLAEAALVRNAVRAQCGPVGIDIVAHQRAEIAILALAHLRCSHGDRVHPAGWHEAADGGFELPGSGAKTGQVAIVLQPVGRFVAQIFTQRAKTGIIVVRRIVSGNVPGIAKRHEGNLVSLRRTTALRGCGLRHER